MMHLACWTALTLSASAATPDDFQGRFAASPEAIAPVVDAAVEEGAAQFSSFVRGIARRRLSKTLRAAEWIAFEKTASGIRIRSSNRPEGVETSLDGAKTSTADDDGKPATIRRWMKDGALQTEACGEDGGCIELRFELADDTLLVTRVTRSPQLTTPITYRLRYARQ